MRIVLALLLSAFVMATAQAKDYACSFYITDGSFKEGVEHQIKVKSDNFKWMDTFSYTQGHISLRHASGYIIIPKFSKAQGSGGGNVFNTDTNYGYNFDLKVKGEGREETVIKGTDLKVVLECFYVR